MIESAERSSLGYRVYEFRKTIHNKVSKMKNSGLMEALDNIEGMRLCLHRLLVNFVIIFMMVSPITCQSVTIMTLGSTLHASKNEVLNSSEGVFELGFYAGKRSSDSASTIYTLAIWYTQTAPYTKTVVWMADRSMNLTSNATVTLSQQGELQVYDSSQVVWTANTSTFNVSQAVLLDTGNLVLYNTRNEVVWQSFDSPTDTLLPRQRFNAGVTLFSWHKRTDWLEGAYSLNWTSDHYLTAMWQIPDTAWTSPRSPYYWRYWAPNDSHSSSSTAELTPGGVFQVTDASSGNLTGVIGNSSDAGPTSTQNHLRMLKLDYDGNLRMYSWTVNNSTEWRIVWEAVSDTCEVYGKCGVFAICGEGGQCYCPDGFQFVDVDDPSEGCQRIHNISMCKSQGQTMAILDSVTYPLTGDYSNYSTVNVSKCWELCLSSCFCQGFSVTSQPDSKGIYRCWLKKGNLFNGHYNNTRTFYLKILNVAPHNRLLSLQRTLTIVSATLSSAIGFLGALVCVIAVPLVRRGLRRLRMKRLEEKWMSGRGTLIGFTYKEIRFMTGNFGEEVGRGGYGSVFKGKIGDRVLVAVKRLDKLSPEETEFVNEVKVIGCIHHNNLVDLHGYCADRNHHRLLVYNYMERGSLDKVLFRGDDKYKDWKIPVLEWRSRYKIAMETARGLAYLHDNVRGQRIIHCDIKPENILLDSTLSAQVGDFGLVRTMNREQTRIMTRKIRGTCGYLAPEWASETMSITAKTDVYSYGMVLLEIVSGRRNLKTAVDVDAHPDWYFPQWAYSKLENGTFLEVVDPLLSGIVDAKEVERALRVAFWCINENPLLRPSMIEVVSYLEGHTSIELPVPRPLFLDDIFGPVDENQPPIFTPSLHHLRHSHPSPDTR